jgi:XTP/dITP diphosphohydrolase
VPNAKCQNSINAEGDILLKRVLVATSNAGKVRDLVGAALAHDVQVEMLPGFSSLPAVVEDGETFEANARKKAEFYSKHADGELVIADDSGLEIDALGGAPGVRSARYAADEHNPDEDSGNSDDEANNARLLRELHEVADEFRAGRFVCVIAAARNGHTLATFHGRAEGMILRAARGSNGFGYDPLFYFPQIGKTFAELTAEEKAKYSHRGAAFRAFLEWEDSEEERHPHSS